MVYLTVDSQAPINQGDIFRDVPCVEMSLASLSILDDDTPRVTSWRDILTEGNEPVTAILPLKPVTAIVVSQNCDNAHGRYITLAQVVPFSQVLGGALPGTAKKWKSKITQHAKTNYRFFYLPAAGSLAFSERMSADFRLLFQVPRTDLEGMRDMRLGRLNEEAAQHFRETVAYFFRRYAYNEWYPLTKEEFEAYAADLDEPVKAYPWQE